MLSPTQLHTLPKRLHEDGNIHKELNTPKISTHTGSNKLWDLMSTYLEKDKEAIERQISDHVEYTLARNRYNFDSFGAYQATAYSVRDRLIEFWNDTNFLFTEENVKQVYYLSIEFLLGRTLQNGLVNLDMEDTYKEALTELGYQLENLYDKEVDAGLGNGGLGRLAACFLDSMASQNYAAWGYGIRYTYGMFRQEIFQGWQAEIPDLWLKFGNPWEITRFDVKYPVRFYGYASENGTWEGGESVIALAHDNPIPGFRTSNTINLRLWSSEPASEFDLSAFNDGSYYKALEKRQSAETISSVLYPNDNTPEGKELRLKQQYFFCCATLADIVRRFKKRGNKDLNLFSTKVAIQLNDTHPTISVAELMRILLDIERVPFETAVQITQQTFSYTNHTVLPEALERWSLPLFEKVLPRHIQIIYQINHRFLEKVLRPRYPNNFDEMARKLSIIEEGNPKMIRMAHLAVIMSHHVNGVAAIHTEILKKTVFKEFYELFPEKFINVTNGITPRRWLKVCNSPLTSLIAKTLGTDNFLKHLDLLTGLKDYADNKDLQAEWMDIKLENKRKLAKYILATCGVEVNPNALFDIQVKRIHEYKRQLLNILRVIYLYHELKQLVVTGADLDDVIPKVIIFGGKAAPGYHRAKLIIKLINSVAERVNNDKTIQNLLKVIFIPNYCVSLAELIIPASDISEHISTAGTEASGTSNMKFCLNGGMIIGTLDGANIEIKDAVGEDNIFIFGLTADQVDEAREANHYKHFIKEPRMLQAVNAIRSGEFGDPSAFNELLDSLIGSRDHYLLGDDFASYLDAHLAVDKAFSDPSAWARKSILNTALMGNFTSDRSIKEYAEKIWNVKPITIPEAKLENQL